MSKLFSKRVFAWGALALALLAPGGTAWAGGTERNCVGALVSTEAREIRPFGAVISQEARSFDFGAVVSVFATTCVLEEP
jgi:hypothetical protein